MRFTRAELASWLDQQTRGQPPPALFVDTSSEDRLAEEPGVQVHAYSFSPESRIPKRDPGCFRFTFDTSRREELAYPVDPSAQLKVVARYLRRRWSNDVRSLIVETGDQSGGSEDNVPVNTSVRVSPQVYLPDRDPIDVVGPGGRLALYREHNEIRGRITMRPVDLNISNRASIEWSPVAPILAELENLFSEDAMLEARFGYFEASWLDRQSVIRPAFLLTVDSSESVGSHYRSEFIAPATTEYLEVEHDPLAGGLLI